MSTESQDEKKDAANSNANSNSRPWLKEHQFQPGQSGNPSGRPKKKWLTEVAEELLEERLSDPEFRKQYKEQLWSKLNSAKVVGAMTLDRLWERTEGKVKEELDVNLRGEVGEILEAIRTRKREKQGG